MAEFQTSFNLDVIRHGLKNTHVTYGGTYLLFEGNRRKDFLLPYGTIRQIAFSDTCIIQQKNYDNAVVISEGDDWSTEYSLRYTPTRLQGVNGGFVYVGYEGASTRYVVSYVSCDYENGIISETEIYQYSSTFNCDMAREHKGRSFGNYVIILTAYNSKTDVRTFEIYDIRTGAKVHTFTTTKWPEFECIALSNGNAYFLADTEFYLNGRHTAHLISIISGVATDHTLTTYFTPSSSGYGMKLDGLYYDPSIEKLVWQCLLTTDQVETQCYTLNLSDCSIHSSVTLPDYLYVNSSIESRMGIGKLVLNGPYSSVSSYDTQDEEGHWIVPTVALSTSLSGVYYDRQGIQTLESEEGIGIVHTISYSSSSVVGKAKLYIHDLYYRENPLSVIGEPIL